MPKKKKRQDVINELMESTQDDEIKIELLKLEEERRKNNSNNFATGAKIGCTAVAIAAYLYAFERGIKFEEEGVYKSPTVKSLIGKINIFK